MGSKEKEPANGVRRTTRADGKSGSDEVAGTAVAGWEDFGSWFSTQAGRLPKDFEIEI
jgi:hypothetical protein